MEVATNVLTQQPVNPALQAANQKVQEAFAPIFELMQFPDFRHTVEFTNAYPMPEVEFTEDGHGIVIRHLPASHTRERLETSPIMGICHELKHLYNDGDRVGKTGIKRKKEKGHKLENNSLRACISYTYLVSSHHGDNEVVIRFYLDQSKANRARTKVSFKRTDVTDEELRELKDSGRLVCHNRSKVIAWHYLSNEEQQDLLRVVLTTCSEEVKTYVRSVYSDAYLRQIVPNYLTPITTPPQMEINTEITPQLTT